MKCKPKDGDQVKKEKNFTHIYVNSKELLLKIYHIIFEPVKNTKGF